MCLVQPTRGQFVLIISPPHSAILEKLRSFSSVPSSKASIILSKFKKLGLFSNETVEARGNLLDTLCGHLEKLMQYEAGESDLVYLQHTFVVERADGKVVSTRFRIRFWDVE